jgi:hypothetical protein
MTILFRTDFRAYRGLLGHVFTVVAVVLLLWVNRGLGQGQSAPPGREEPGASKVTAQRLAMAGGTEGRLRYLEGSRPPVGTVMAFAGAWPPKKPGGGAWTERELGWLRCDGRTFAALRKDLGFGPQELDELQVALEQDGLPDYSGYFLRGVGGGAPVNPDAATRVDSQDPRKVIGDRAGSVQGGATRRPNAPFMTDDPRDHQHIGPTNNGLGGGAEVPRQESGVDWIKGAPTSPSGHHRHTVTAGGDHETTAVNIFRKSKSRLKTRGLSNSDGCRINSLGKHFPGRAMKNLDNSAENAVFPGCCTCRRSSPQWTTKPAR